MKLQHLAAAALFLILCNVALFYHQLPSSNGEEIRLGVMAPLTGDFASYGHLIRDGLELAEADLNAQSLAQGYRLRFIFEDVALPGPLAATAAQRLSFVSRVHAVAANFFNPAIPVAAPILARSGTPIFHTAAADDVILSSGPLVFTTNSRIRDEACRAAELARSKLKAERAAVSYVQTNFGESYQRHFTRCFQDLGGSVVFNEGTPVGTRDFRELLLRLRSSHPDVIFSGHFGMLLGALVKQAREEGISQQFIGVYESEDQSVLETGGTAAEGLLFFVPEPREPSSARRSFLQRFEKRFGYQPGILAANAYDAARILSETLMHCRLDKACAGQRLNALGQYDGVSGTFSLGGDHAATKEFVLKTVHGGRFERVEEPRSEPEL